MHYIIVKSYSFSHKIIKTVDKPHVSNVITNLDCTYDGKLFILKNYGNWGLTPTELALHRTALIKLIVEEANVVGVTWSRRCECRDTLSVRRSYCHCRFLSKYSCTCSVAVPESSGRLACFQRSTDCNSSGYSTVNNPSISTRFQLPSNCLLTSRNVDRSSLSNHRRANRAADGKSFR